MVIPPTGAHAQLPLPSAGRPLPTPIDLPDHVDSMEVWGATIIDFDKYKGLDMTYAELLERRQTDANAESYVKWVMSHGEKSSGYLHDLFKYASS